MTDQRIQSSEEMVGAGHVTKADTLNRLALVEHNNDGTHKDVNAESVSISGAFIGPTAGIIDIVQAYDSGIATSDTLAIGPFAFVPSKIVIEFRFIRLLRTW